MSTLAVSLPTRLWNLAHAFLLILVFFAISGVRQLHAWPIFWLAGMAVYFAVMLATPPLRSSFQPWRIGRLTPLTIAATVVISVTASVTLLWFQWFSAPKVTSLAHLVPHQVLGSVILAGIVFSVLNAIMEEVAFRGVMYDGVTAVLGPWTAIISTSLLFGFGHLEGYPPGPLGAVLAGIYGLMLGWLRYVSGGLLLPFLSHIVADATIFHIVHGWQLP